MVVAFPCKIGAPVTGITLSTRVGRLSETHSDTGFQLTQVTLGRKVREQKGAWVRALERFNIVVTKAAAIKSAAQLLGTSRFGGDSMKNHGIKQSELDSVVKSSGCRYVERASSFDILV